MLDRALAEHQIGLGGRQLLRFRSRLHDQRDIAIPGRVG